jgi:hypothetical protein
LSVRTRDESSGDLRYDLAAWKHYEFAGDINSPVLKEVANYCAAVVNDPQMQDNTGVKSQEAAHLLYLAAAEALLAPEVSAILNSLGIEAPTTSDNLQAGYFEFVVLDSDKTLKCNSCEIVRANRVTTRLLGKSV